MLATSTTNAVTSLIVIVILALVHLFVRELRRLQDTTRNALLSFGAGASLAYVLMRILPRLAGKQADFVASAETGLRGFLEHHAYLVAMVGLVVYYGISRIAAYGAADVNRISPQRMHAALVFTTLGYSAYSLLIAYLIVNRLNFGLFSVLLITIGMATLFLVSDHGLCKMWPGPYNRWMRWMLSLGLLAGWAIGVWVEVSPNMVALWYAFLAGIMLITTIGEKLSIEARGSFWPFLAGVVAFTVLLLILEQMPEAVV